MSNNPNLDNSDDFVNDLKGFQAQEDAEIDNIVDDIDLGGQTPQGPQNPRPQPQNEVEEVLNNLVGQQTAGQDAEEFENPYAEGEAFDPQERARLEAIQREEQQRQATQGQIRDQAMQAMQDDDEEIDGDTPQSRRRAKAIINDDDDQSDIDSEADETPSRNRGMAMSGQMFNKMFTQPKEHRLSKSSVDMDMYDEPDPNVITPDQEEMELYAQPENNQPTQGRPSMSLSEQQLYDEPDNDDLTPEDEKELYEEPKNKNTRGRDNSRSIGDW